MNWITWWPKKSTLRKKLYQVIVCTLLPPLSVGGGGGGGGGTSNQIFKRGGGGGLTGPQFSLRLKDKVRLRMKRRWISNPGVPCSKPLDGSKVDSAFYPSEVNKMSTRTFWELSSKK